MNPTVHAEPTTPPATEAAAPPVAPRRAAWRRTVAGAAAVSGATVGLLVVTLRLWEANLRVPFVYNATNKPPLTYAPDAPYYLMVTKSLITHGWYLHNVSLGAPFSQQLYDKPEGVDNLQLAVMKVLGVVLRNTVLTVNVYFLLTFVAVALAAWFVLIRLGTSRLVASVVALLYAFLPYHFARGEAHILLSGYFMVPVAALLILRVLSDRPPFTAESAGRWRISLATGNAIAWLAACAALGSTGPYYAWFTMLLLGLVVVLDVFVRRNWRTVAAAGVAIATILVVFLLNLAPTFAYWAGHGTNRSVAKRGPSETEVDGLKVSQLVLPVQGHRIGALADVQDKSVRYTVIPSERGQQLGLIGALGFVGLLGATLARALRHRWASPPPIDRSGLPPPGDIVVRLGVLTILAILFGAVSGFSLLVSGLGLKEIRSWNRLSIFIGFFALVAVAIALDRLLPRLPRWRGRAVLAGAVCVAVLAVGVLDQTTTDDVPKYRALERSWNSDEAFMGHIQRELRPGASVFQLPYVFFPEAGMVQGTGPYDQVRGWLHAGALRWSWGGVRGRDADWQAAVVRLQPAAMLDAITAVGFSGLMVDRAGYPNRADVLEYALTRQLGRPRVSRDERLLFYDLRAWGRALRARIGPEQLAALRRQTLAARVS